MITELPESQGAIIGVEITGKVSEEEELRWIARFDEAIEKYGKVSGLLLLADNAHWGLKAGFEDIRWCFTHTDKMEKIAIVADGAVWQWLIGIDSPFAKLFGVKEKYFERSAINEAWEWLKQ
jgi:hypothetical protein